MIKLQDILNEVVGNPTTELVNTLQGEFKKLLPNVYVNKNTIAGSTLLGKDNKPIVRIDSKAKPTAILVKVDNSDNIIGVTVLALVNNKENNLPKYGEKLFEVITKTIIDQQKQNADFEYQIVISHDVSGGFWKYQETKYPTIKFIYKES
jgi:hypothetical protein